jgi:hypothetical protein
VIASVLGCMAYFRVRCRVFDARLLQGLRCDCEACCLVQSLCLVAYVQGLESGDDDGFGAQY